MKDKAIYRAPDGTNFLKLKMEEVGEVLIYSEDRIIDRQQCKLIEWDAYKRRFIVQLGNIHSDKFAKVKDKHFPIERFDTSIGEFTIIYKSLICRI